MSIVDQLLDRAHDVASKAEPRLRQHAIDIVIDSVLTTMLGHSAPAVMRIVAGEPSASSAPSTVFSLPAGRLGVERAAYVNALALCWYELDPGLRHVGCHVPLHTLPTLLAIAEARGCTVRDFITQFVFCYEVVAGIAATWDTRPSGLHSHAVFSHLGAVVAVAATLNESAAFIARALDLASSAVNAGNAWEVSEGGELRNLWPALAAANALSLYRAAKAGITTAPGRLEKSFDRQFRRRAPAEGARNGGPALLQSYGKLLPACRHLHAVISAALTLTGRIDPAEIGDIDAVEVTVHAEAAALSSLTATNAINAQFSLPVSVAIALVSGRFDPDGVTALRADPAVEALAVRVKIVEAHDRPYPLDRSADVAIVFSDGRRLAERADIAAGDPAEIEAQTSFLDRKVAALADAFPPASRGPFLEAVLTVRTGFQDEDRPLSWALSGSAGYGAAA